MRSSPSLMALLVVAAVGCAGTLAAPASPDVTHRMWFEVTTEHIALITDLPRATAIARADEMEAWWRALAASYQLLAPGVAPPVGTIPAVHFENCADFAAVWSWEVGGAVTQSNDFESRRIMYTCDREPELQREVIIHELAHHMNHHFFVELPPWLEEGLASYFETLQLPTGQLVLGQVIAQDAYHARHSRFLPTVATLRAMEPVTFYVGGRRHYHAAWRLVHLLANGSAASNARFRAYLGALGAGADRDAAWTNAFGGLARGELQDQYRRYLKGFEIRLWARPYQPPPLAPPRVRQLSAGEIHETWMLHILNLTPDDGVAAARRQLAFAEQDDPHWPQAPFWHARLTAFGGDDHELAEGVRLLRTQVAANPGDARAWLALVRLRLTAAVPTSHTGVEATPPPGLDALAADVAGLARHASTAAELDAVAAYYALRRQPATGLGFARRAIAADRSCVSCEDTLALLLFRAGRAAEAVAHEQRAITRAAETGVPEAFRIRLAAYQAAAHPR